MRNAITITVALLLFVAACTEADTDPTRSPVHTVPVEAGSVEGEIPQDLLEEIRQDAALHADVDAADIEVVDVTSVEFEDASLDCPEDGADQTIAPVAGWRVMLDAAGEELDYRAAEHRYFKLCENPEGDAAPIDG